MRSIYFGLSLIAVAMFAIAIADPMPGISVASVEGDEEVDKAVMDSWDPRLPNYCGVSALAAVDSAIATNGYTKAACQSIQTALYYQCNANKWTCFMGCQNCSEPIIASYFYYVPSMMEASHGNWKIYMFQGNR